MKYVLYLFFLSLINPFLSLVPCSKAQTSGYWLSPVNQVPFEVVYEDSTLTTLDSTIILFAGEPTFTTSPVSPDSVLWNVMSDSIYSQLFGFEAVMDSSNLLTYDLLFSPGFQIIINDAWDLTNWNTIVNQEPWIVNRSLKMNSGDMGAALAFDWYNMNLENAKLVLDPTVPVIEGDDMDYSTLPSNVSFVFDVEDFKTASEENQAVISHSVYTFNKPDFKDIYNPDFKNWMILNKPFLPHTFDFNTYHEWLYEYLYGIAQSKISEIVSVNELENSFDIIRLGNGVYKVFTLIDDVNYSIHSIDGKIIQEDQVLNHYIDLGQEALGMYFITFKTTNNKTVTFKLIN